MPTNEVVVRYDGTDITSSVIFDSARFSMQADAMPGEFIFRCKDPDQTLDFVTGKEITVDVDGFRLYGGYLLQVSRTFAFDADDTSSGVDYQNRIWELRGVDYNRLFDTRFTRNTANYLNQIDTGLANATDFDGEAIELVLASYIDTPAGFDTTTKVENVATLGVPTAAGNYLIQQGKKLRHVFETVTLRSGAVWYINPEKEFVYAALESVESRWGFSDNPNNATVSSGTGFQGATYGFREVEAIEDGSFIVNDALVWGGGEFAGTGSTVFARTQDATSQATHGRWQIAETHFGEFPYGIQDGVDARADVIVEGPPGADSLGQQKGLRFAQWSFRFIWFGQDVPLIGGIPDHLLPGDLVTIELSIFDEVRLLPLRALSITFPTLAETGEAYVRFEGQFALNLADPWTLWKYILKSQDRIQTVLDTPTISTSNDDSTTYQYGSIGYFTPTPAPNGSATVFTIAVGYISGSLRVIRNGLEQLPGTSFTESDPDAGEFTMTPAPLVTDWLFVICRTLEG